MRGLTFCLTLLVACGFGRAANAVVVLDTQSTATQMIFSPLVGGFASLSATGSQRFILDPATGFADVNSDLKGSDFPTLFGFANYDLYNTTTIGSVTQTLAGTYDIVFELLFELKLTSGPLAGTTFETKQLATFAALGVPSLPFPDGTAFSDPAPPSGMMPPDTVLIFLKTDPSGILGAFGLSPGDMVGASFGRVVTADTVNVVPEPGTLALLGTGGIGMAFGAWRKKRQARAQAA